MFWRIAVPLALPAIVTTFVLNVYIQWSELLLALVLLPRSLTLTVSVATLSGETQAPAPVLAAAAILTALPIIVIFLATRRLRTLDVRLGPRG